MNLNDLDRFRFSFRNALIGINTAYTTQRNLRIHLIIIIPVVIAAFLFKVSYTDWLVLILTIMMVIISEIFNTALEFTVDLVSPEFNKQAKKAKDVSAAGVLVTTIFAILIGTVVFIPKIVNLVASFYK